MSRFLPFYLLLTCLIAVPVLRAGAQVNWQAEIDANPGGSITIPAGEHLLDAPLRITAHGTRVSGDGILVQRTPSAPVVVIENARGVTVRGITVTRTDYEQEAMNSGILVLDAAHVTLDDVRVIANKARDAAIQIRDSEHVTVRDCLIRDYKRIAIDDRSDSELYGYAFRCIDGTGILANQCTHLAIESNRVIEESLIPTQELKDEFDLGRVVPGRNPDAKPGELGKTVAAAGYASNWHQGSAIVVTGPEVSRHNTVRGNHIVNAAQGIDLHCDFTVVADNIIDHCFVGLKATHGCQGLILSGNLVSHVDLWGILVNPGAASRGTKDGEAPNVDGGITIANNIITHYGYGHEFWNWGGREEDRPGSYAIALYDGQLAENPPLRDVSLTGNIVYDPGRDTGEPPRYRYAVWVGSWHGPPEASPNLAEGLTFAGNRFHPGLRGISNSSALKE